MKGLRCRNRAVSPDLSRRQTGDDGPSNITRAAAQDTDRPPNLVRGYWPREGRLNVRNELRKLGRDPIEDLLAYWGVPPVLIAQRGPEIQAYRSAFVNYYLTLTRLLPEMSLMIRYSNIAGLARKEGRKYSSAERNLADQFNPIARYVELDFVNTLIHGRVLLDRIAGLSRHFLRGPHLPSFTSFADHKAFLTKRADELGAFADYAGHIRTETDWFDTLKEARDKFVVHAGPQHTMTFGFPGRARELSMMVFIWPREPNSRLEILYVSVVHIVRSIHAFQEWFADYGRRRSAKGAMRQLSTSQWRDPVRGRARGRV